MQILFPSRFKHHRVLLSCINRKLNIRYKINGSFLDKGIITHQHAWFWGLALSDGCISSSKGKANGVDRIVWSLKYDDYVVLDTLRTIVDSTHPIYFYRQTSGYGPTMMCRLSLHSRQMAKRAEQMLDCDPSRKAFDLKLPHLIQTKFYSSLIRGIVEGDGCWTIEKTRGDMNVRIASSNLPLLESIRNIINKFCLNNSDHSTSGRIYRTGSRNANCYELKYMQRSMIRDIGQWLYDEDSINCGNIMQRKYKRYMFFKELFIDNPLPKKERIPIMHEFVENEKREQQEILQTVLQMHRMAIPCPSHYLFGQSMD